jgi:hypothetical protein
LAGVVWQHAALCFDPACTNQKGAIMAKRKKQSKVQKRGKLPRGNAAKHGKARRVSKAAQRTVAKAKPKPRPSKKAAQKQPVAPAVETLVDTTEIREDSDQNRPV